MLQAEQCTHASSTAKAGLERRRSSLKKTSQGQVRERWVVPHEDEGPQKAATPCTCQTFPQRQQNRCSSSFPYAALTYHDHGCTLYC